MTKLAVAHTATTFGDNDEIVVNVGDTFEIIETAKNIMQAIVLAQFEDDDDAIVVDFGEGFMVMTLEPDEDGRSFGQFFEIKEVA